MALTLNDEKRTDKRPVLQVGEPVKPESPWYEKAVAFRSVIDKLGLKAVHVTRELAEGATPVLEQLLKQHELVGNVELVVIAKVQFLDGHSETITSETITASKLDPSKKRR